MCSRCGTGGFANENAEAGRRMSIRVGLGSWSDAEYRGILYPPGLAAGERLRGYARWFSHVEVNASFYTIPTKEQLARWAAQVPQGFLFDFKLHKTLSGHATSTFALPRALRGKASGKLTPGGAWQKEVVAYTLEQAKDLQRAGMLGVFLLLPAPQFVPERGKLEDFDPLVEALRKRGQQLATELRQRAWVEGKQRARTLAYFRERGIAWVAVDVPKGDAPNLMPAIDEVTQPELAYLRLHGRNLEGYLHGKSAAERFDYDYRPAELREIVKRITKLAAAAREVRVVASNHAHDFAPKAALELKRLLGQPLQIALEVLPKVRKKSLRSKHVEPTFSSRKGAARKSKSARSKLFSARGGKN